MPHRRPTWLAACFAVVAAACARKHDDAPGLEAAVDATDDVVLVGRLLESPAAHPDCGTFHFAVVLRWQVEHVEQGRCGDAVVYAAVGCPELPRAQYGAGAGDATALRAHDRYRLVLHRPIPSPRGGITLIDAYSSDARPRYWVARVDDAR